jgi:hypothetical protein
MNMKVTIMTTSAMAVVAGMALASIAFATHNSKALVLAKTGTTGGRTFNLDSQSTKSQPVTTVGSMDAERGGNSDGLPAACSQLQQLVKL